MKTRPTPSPRAVPRWESPCSICKRPDAATIEEALRDGRGLSDCAAAYKLHKPLLANHKAFCLRGAHARPRPMVDQIPMVEEGLGRGQITTKLEVTGYKDLGDGVFVPRDFVRIPRLLFRLNPGDMKKDPSR